MPKTSQILINDKFIKTLEKPTNTAHKIYWDGKTTGFGVRITKSGAISFVLRYVLHGRERKYTIGSYPTHSALSARETAIKLKGEIAKGFDPLEKRRYKAIAGELGHIIYLINYIECEILYLLLCMSEMLDYYDGTREKKTNEEFELRNDSDWISKYGFDNRYRGGYLYYQCFITQNKKIIHKNRQDFRVNIESFNAMCKKLSSYNSEFEILSNKLLKYETYKKHTFDIVETRNSVAHQLCWYGVMAHQYNFDLRNGNIDYISHIKVMEEFCNEL